MRELELKIDEALRFGIAPELSVPPGAPVLLDCHGFRCGKYWLEGFKPFYDPIPNLTDPVYEWPFPQVRAGSRHRLLIVREEDQVEDRVYQLSPDGTSADFIISLDWDVFGKGDWYDLADFGKFAVLTNGAVMINFDISSSLWQVDTTTPIVGTICNFNGQAIAGNVKSPWYDCDETYIIWSDIGNYDFSINRGNKAGYRRDHYGGIVYRVKQLGNSVLVYSSNGITQMIPTIEPTPAFGFQPVHDIGLLSPYALAGYDSIHVFIDSAYNVCRMTEKGIEVVGYSYLIKELSDIIVVSYDRLNKDFYISDGTTTFLLSPFGLTRVPQNISAIWDTYAAVRTQNREPGKIITHEFDFGYRATKTIFAVELGARNFNSARGAIQWKVSDGDFKQTSLLPFNKMKWLQKVITGSDFRVYIELDNITENTVLEYIKVRYKMTDLRNLRGVYAPPPRGQLLE